MGRNPRNVLKRQIRHAGHKALVGTSGSKRVCPDESDIGDKMARRNESDEMLEMSISDSLCDMAEINLGAPFRAIQTAMDKMDMGDIERRTLMSYIVDEVELFHTNQVKWCEDNQIA